MLPMQFADKRTALLGAFASRFAVGFTIGCVQLPWPGWLTGFTRLRAGSGDSGAR